MNVSDVTENDDSTTWNDKGKIANIQAEVQYDDSMLELQPVYNEDHDYIPDMFPQFSDSIVSNIENKGENKGKVSFNDYKIQKGFVFDTNNCILVKCVFKVIAEGNSYITLPILYMAATYNESGKNYLMLLVEEGEKKRFYKI